jgi:hypothetical protein
MPCSYPDQCRCHPWQTGAGTNADIISVIEMARVGCVRVNYRCFVCTAISYKALHRDTHTMRTKMNHRIVRAVALFPTLELTMLMPNPDPFRSYIFFICYSPQGVDMIT